MSSAALRHHAACRRGYPSCLPSSPYTATNSKRAHLQPRPSGSSPLAAHATIAGSCRLHSLSNTPLSAKRLRQLGESKAAPLQVFPSSASRSLGLGAKKDKGTAEHTSPGKSAAMPQRQAKQATSDTNSKAAPRYLAALRRARRTSLPSSPPWRPHKMSTTRKDSSTPAPAAENHQHAHINTEVVTAACNGRP